MQQYLINPDTNERVWASEKHGKILRDQGWVDARPSNAPPVDHGPIGIIVQNLRVSDYNEASTDRIYRFLQSGDREYAQGVLDYERSHQDRGIVIQLAQARLAELGPAPASNDSDDADDAERPAKNASREDWNAYAESLGLAPEDYSSKDDVIAAVDEAEQD